MNIQALAIDLRGKNLEEVLSLLQRGGFTLRSPSKTSVWDERGRMLHDRMEDGPPVHIVWIKDEEAPHLTVTIFNGKQITLKPGMDLHLFGRPPCEPAGQDWSTLRTLDVMR